MSLLQTYKNIRQHTENICKPLKTEDYVVQPVVDTSPPKWHIGHTTWFFETFVLKEYMKTYREFHPDYNFVFNSYYETVGNRVIRTDRGNLSRPTVSYEIYSYRNYVDQAMEELLSKESEPSLTDLVVLGCNHEQQHQELLWTDIKYILGHNPLFPAYVKDSTLEQIPEQAPVDFINMPAGIYQIGYEGDDFCFDNERELHNVYLQGFSICSELVSNGEFLEFINDEGYSNFKYWHAEGFDWAKTRTKKSPLYWHWLDNGWYYYTLKGLLPIDWDQPVCHISYFEAAAFAQWKGLRLPTETEWEAAAKHFNWGKRWEWTESAYLPYPGFTKAEGAIGEYNGKFMINQMVLRGASVATPDGHSRVTYRNFFHPSLQWQYSGIRLAK